MPKVALFVPCYVDQLYPQVAEATLRLLERHGCTVTFPEAQTCCGQPMSNSGERAAAVPLCNHFLDVFRGHEYVVAPSGSCVGMVRNQFPDLVPDHPALAEVRAATFELCEFLHDVLGVRRVEGRFPRKVGLHRSCHAQRELRLASGSERQVPPFDKVKTLLGSLEGITLVEPARTDECCGFGGTFAVAEEAVSCLMGRDRLDEHAKAGAEVITGVDMSCLMHLEGLARREGRPVRILHAAQVLLGEAA
jgi:L-lactate dehydrogenase complex protein LldE